MLFSVPCSNHCCSICCCASSVSRAQVFYLTAVSSFNDINRATVAALGEACKLHLVCDPSHVPLPQHLTPSLQSKNSGCQCITCCPRPTHWTPLIGACFWMRNRWPLLAEVLLRTKNCLFFYYSERVSFKEKRKKILELNVFHYIQFHYWFHINVY